MEQNTQASENNNQVENGVLFKKPKKKNNKKIVLLAAIIIIILSAIASYFLFFSDKENENVPVSEDKKVEEINKELDSDQDGLPDYIEKVLGTDLNNSDTDGDSYSDFEEIKNGYNPLNDKKYTEEEWEEVKEGMRNESEGLYEEMFGGFDRISDNCDAFPNKLELCESFSCKFEHPFTGEMMERKIVGLVSDKCQYIEEMPNNGKMDCEYSESLRKAIAQYYRDIAVAESVGTGVEANLGSGDVKTTYIIDGKEVENPLQEAMNSGECVISVSDSKNKCPSGTEYKGETYTYENGKQIAHPVCSDPNMVCSSCDNCISGMTKKVINEGKEVCYECLFDKDCKKNFHCADHKCIN